MVNLFKILLTDSAAHNCSATLTVMRERPQMQTLARITTPAYKSVEW